MSCYRSFILDYDISGQLSLLSGATNTFYQSGSGTAPNICVSTIIRMPVSPSPTAVAEFLPQGYKNIDVYGFHLIGHLASNSGTAQNGIIQNWGIELNTIGTYGEVGGNTGVTAVNYLPVLQPVHLGINNLNPKIEFPSPIKSVTNISLQRLFFSASNLQSLTDFAFVSNIGIVVYYKFEGE
jgi:hypothetical protein